MTTVVKNQAIRKILKAEKDDRLWQLRVWGYPVWALLRLHRYHYLMQNEAATAGSEKKPSHQSWKQRRWIPLLNGLSSLRTLFVQAWRRDIWVLTTTNYVREGNNNNYYCIFAEDLREQVPDRVLFVQTTSNGLRINKHKEVLDISAFHMAAMLGAKVLYHLGLRSRVKTQNRIFADQQENARVTQLAIYGRIEELIFGIWLRVAKPKAIFVLCSYGIHIPVQRVARRLKIPLIEIQHGIIHGSHPGYVFDEQDGPDYLPNHIVVFGKYYESILQAASSYWSSRTSAGGHGWMRKKIASTPQDKQNRIVLFSQPEEPVREQIKEFVQQLSSSLAPNWHILVKPHPREDDAASYWSFLSDINVKLTSYNEDTYQLLNESKIAISVYSSVAIEALAFSCISFVLPSMHWPSEFHDFFSSGSLKVANSVEDIVSATQYPDQQANSVSADHIFGVNGSPIDYLHLIDKVQGRLAATQ